MVQKAYFYVNYNNIVVLQTYLDVIKAALEKIGFCCEYTKDLSLVSKSELIIFPLGIDAFKYYFKGYHNFFLWQQGVTAEESYMRNHSKFRFDVLNYIDCFVMKKAKLIFFVSDNLRKYYEKKAHSSFEDKSYVMPCFNEEFDATIIRRKDYTKKIFAYVGSLDLWQCFDKTVELFGEIKKYYPEAVLKVLTFQKEEAKNILEKKGIKQYYVDCVSKEQVKKELADVTYGFIIRDDIEVNRVATPTKFSSYLSAGVLPIYSACLEDFANASEGLNISCKAETIDEVRRFIEMRHENSEMEHGIEILFDEYYSIERHQKNIESLIYKLNV